MLLAAQLDGGALFAKLQVEVGPIGLWTRRAGRQRRRVDTQFQVGVGQGAHEVPVQAGAQGTLGGGGDGAMADAQDGEDDTVAVAQQSLAAKNLTR